MQDRQNDYAGLECLGVPLPAATELTLGALLRQAVLGWLRLGRRQRR